MEETGFEMDLGQDHNGGSCGVAEHLDRGQCEVEFCLARDHHRCSMVAAGLAFLLATLNAGLKAKGFAVAARELEAAIARYRFDDELPEKYLAQAEVRGIEILYTFDSKKSGS
jgi:hypothetical protein